MAQNTPGVSDMPGGPLAASLLAVARCHGVRVSADSIVAGLPLEGGVLTPACLSRAAERAGFTTRFAGASLEEINPMLCPVILLMEGERSCVLVSITPDTAQLLLPDVPEGQVSVPLDELKREYMGIAVYIKPRFRFDHSAPRQKRHDGWFWDAVSAQKPLYRDIIIASVLSNLFALAMPLFTMNVYNRVVPNNATESLWVMAVGVFIMISADFALHMARGYLVDLAAARTNIRAGAQMMEQVLGMRAEDRPQSVGASINSVQGFDSVRSFISSATVFAYVDMPFALFFLGVIAVISWQLAVPLAIGSLLVMLQAVLVQRQMRDLSETTNRAGSMKNSTLVESLVAIETVKSQGAEGHTQGRWEKTCAFLENTGVRMRLLSSAVVNWTQWVQITVSIATLVVGVYLIKANTISMGSLIAASMLSSRAMAPISRVAGLLMQYYSASRSLTSLDEIMSKKTEHPEGAAFISRPVLQGGVEFRDVSFAYPEQEHPALSGVSFSISPGERVAFIGPIGSGKTTIAKLMLNFYSPTQGMLLVDGVDIRQIDPAELRRNMGSVLQDVMLFLGSLRDNLLVGARHVTDTDLLDACRISGVSIFAGMHPKGFDMQVGERGSNLSFGQRQAVSLARAILKNPPIMLLDEPTSSVDSGTEEHIRREFGQFVRGRTLVLITHRTALLSLVDRVIVLDGGRIAADGPRDEVIDALKHGRIRKG